MASKVTGSKSLSRSLNHKLQSSDAKIVEVVVGYTQSYALVVHEVDARHAEGKQKKYLEGPARQYARQIADVSRNTPGTMEQRLVRSGLFLQRKSQDVVPIDTGALKSSAFTALAEEADNSAREAWARSEEIRLAAKSK
jgi:hypothetical protein